MPAHHTEDEHGHARVIVRGLAAPLRFLHLTDSHIDRGTDLGYEGSAMNFGLNMHQRYEYVPDPAAFKGASTPDRGKSFWRLQGAAEKAERTAGGQPVAGSYHAADIGPTAGQIRPYNVFEEQLQMARAGGADLLAHTGNLVNFPSFRGIYYVWNTLEKSGIPYMYTPGNHDWCWQDMVGTKPVSELRQQYCWDPSAECATLFSRGSESSVLSTEQYDPMAWCEEFGGVRFIGIDNSTQRVTDQQLAFLQAELTIAADTASPVIVMLHIPLYTPELRRLLDEAGVPPNIDWASVEVDGALCGDPHASQRGAQGASTASDDIPVDSPTSCFIKEVSSSAQVIAIISGHVQQTHSTPIGTVGCVQYVTAAGYAGAHRWFDLVPSADVAKL